jgi:hypothetical protein
MNLRMEMELSCTFVVASLLNRRVSPQGQLQIGIIGCVACQRRTAGACFQQLRVLRIER